MTQSEMFDSPALAALAASLLEERKIEEYSLLDVRGLCDFTDFFVIVEIESRTQMRALADLLRRGLKGAGEEVSAEDLQPETTWLVVDSGSVIIHLFLPEARKYYNLERLWGDALRPAWRDLEGADEAEKAAKAFLESRIRPAEQGSSPMQPVATGT